MGWIIRFIHNRDKATSNIVYQCSRASMLAMVPFDVLRNIRKIFLASGSKVHERSIIMDAEAVMNSKQTSSAGMFTVGIRSSRRNTKTLVAARGKLRTQIKNHLTKTKGPAHPRGKSVTVSVMTAGIWVNGRQWKEGMYGSYSNFIPRASRPESVRQMIDDLSTYSVCQIISFHVYRPDDLKIVIARVWRYKVHSIWRGMWIMYNVDPEKIEYISIDRIVHGIHRVVHWDDKRKWVGMPWWKAI
jgi:hypothetical protein